MKTYLEKTWVGTIYVGSREGYEGPQISEEKVRGLINEYQREAHEDECGCVTLTKTLFTFGDYAEPGWAIGLIAYPRFPLSEESLHVFALKLAEHLLRSLRQNRVSAVLPGTTIMLEREDGDGE